MIDEGDYNKYNKWDQGQYSQDVLTPIINSTSGLEGSSLLEVFTFEKELFSTSELVKRLTRENLGVVDMAGYSFCSSFYVSQCDAHCGSKNLISFVVYFLSPALCRSVGRLSLLYFISKTGLYPQLSYLYQSTISGHIYLCSTDQRSLHLL